MHSITILSNTHTKESNTILAKKKSTHHCSNTQWKNSITTINPHTYKRFNHNTFKHESLSFETSNKTSHHKRLHDNKFNNNRPHHKKYYQTNDRCNQNTSKSNRFAMTWFYVLRCAWGQIPKPGDIL